MSVCRFQETIVTDSMQHNEFQQNRGNAVDVVKGVDILIAILAKDKAHCLQLYLQCINNQTYPTKHIHLYIRTNDNKDDTSDVLEKYIEENGTKYASIFYDKTNISETLKTYGHHEWNKDRFSILGKIRQDSIDYAIKLGVDYFVIDCDNFITPNVISEMVKIREFGVLSPMLETTNYYSNFHYACDDNGYYANDEKYMDVLYRKIKGLIEVKVVHCTYYIKNEILPLIRYADDTSRHEYVIFSERLRKMAIPQYIDNRQFYGFIVFDETKEEFEKNVSTNWSSKM